MEKKFKLGVIGAGFMSTAIVKGVLHGKYLDNKQIIVSDINTQSLEKIGECGVSTTFDNNEVLSNSEYILFAIKPQSFLSVADKIASNESYKIISIMAGTKKQKIKDSFPNSIVARCMPNTPCSVGYGAVGMDLSDYNDKRDVDFVSGLFSAFSKIYITDESQMNAITGISGSSPAYFYLFLKGIIDTAVKHGIPEVAARQLAVNTMIGSGMMVLNNTDKSLEELINAVCSKGGTTIEAIKKFNDNKLSVITEEAIDACINRSVELEKL